jgi:hypothetical protein
MVVSVLKMAMVTCFARALHSPQSVRTSRHFIWNDLYPAINVFPGLDEFSSMRRNIGSVLSVDFLILGPRKASHVVAGVPASARSLHLLFRAPEAKLDIIA